MGDKEFRQARFFILIAQTCALGCLIVYLVAQHWH